MIVTEKEAKEKYCVGAAYAESSTWKCLGSKCMAWEWLDSPRQMYFAAPIPFAIEEPERPAHVPAEFVWRPHSNNALGVSLAGWMETEEAATARRRGCCGLASVSA